MKLKPLACSLFLILVLGCGSGSKTTGERLAIANWGGNHMVLRVTEGGGTTEYDCAHGYIDEPIMISTDGKFEVRGRHVFEKGGPVSSTDRVEEHPALYTGHLDGENLTVRVFLTERKLAVGTYQLKQGSSGRIVKCL